MSYRIRFVGNDLVIDTPDGERHDLGPIPGTADSGLSPRAVVELVEKWAADQGDRFKGDQGNQGEPGRDANPLAVADRLFKPVTERLVRELSEPVTARLEDGLLDRVVERLSKPTLRALAAQLLKPVIEQIESGLPNVENAAREQAAAEARAWVEQNLDTLRGKDGVDGVDGDDGAVGPVPRHEWKGTRIRFETPTGWGEWRDLEGRQGRSIEQGFGSAAAGDGGNGGRLPILNIADGSLIANGRVDARGLRYEVA